MRAGTQSALMLWATLAVYAPRMSMSDPEQQLLERALCREPAAVRALIEQLTPVVRARVARALLRRGARSYSETDVADLSQEVFVSLFTADARSLRAWQPERGLSLLNFVGLLAQHRVADLLRHSSWRRRSDEIELDDSQMRPSAPAGSPDSEAKSAAQQELARVLEHLEATLSVRGLEMFDRLYVKGQSTEEIVAETGLSSESVYQWRSRLARAARDARACVHASAHRGLAAADPRTARRVP